MPKNAGTHNAYVKIVAKKIDNRLVHFQLTSSRNVSITAFAYDCVCLPKTRTANAPSERTTLSANSGEHKNTTSIVQPTYLTASITIQLPSPPESGCDGEWRNCGENECEKGSMKNLEPKLRRRLQTQRAENTQTHTSAMTCTKLLAAAMAFCVLVFHCCCCCC